MSSADAVEASRRLQEAARQLAHLTRGLLDHPSSSHIVMGNLLDAQRSLEQTLLQLAEWHRRTAPGVHYKAHHEESALGVMTAVAELDLAAQQADGLQETIARAYGGNSVVRWFDEEQDPGE